MRKFSLWLVIFTLMLPLLAYNSPTSIAQDQGTVVAEGLNGPMGVLIDEDGTIWVIDSGLGGDEEVPFTDAQTGETSATPYGETAQIMTIAPDGTQTTVATLPSIATPSDIIGGARLAVLNGKVYATVGQWLGDASMEAGVPNAGVVAEISDGTVSTVASTWDFERSENPDGLAADSHPYGLTASPDGALWVADAGANTLLRVNPLTGRTSLVAVFEGVSSPFPNPARNNEMLTDPVPTAVVAKDGTIFVSLLPGFPFTPGSAKVVTVGEDGTISDYATNLTMLTDLQLGPDNELYGVQFAEFGEQGPTPNSGALVRIGEGDTSEVVLDGLSFPTAVTFDGMGDAYLAINGVGAPGSGQVVMYAGIASGAGAADAANEENTDVADTEAMTDTMTLTDTMTMTVTEATTDTMILTDTADISDTVAMTDAVTMADAMAMTDTMTTTAEASAPPAEATADATPEPMEEPIESTSAPESMPTTGISANDISQNTLPVVVLILMALAAAALATRRRQA